MADPSLPASHITANQPQWNAFIDDILRANKSERQAVLAMLSQGKPEELLNALPLLLQLAHDKSSTIRAQTIDLLAILGEQAPIDPLIVALTDSYWDVRAAAAQALGKHHNFRSLQTLLYAFQCESDMSVREAIIKALGMQGAYMPINMLISVLQNDPDWLVRQAAAWALGQAGHKIPISPLVQALHHDPDESVRATAARSLGKADNDEVEDILIQILRKEKDQEVIEAAALALQQRDKETQGMQYRHANYHTKFDDDCSIQPFTRSTVWEGEQRHHAFQEIARFIRDKQGCVNRSEVITTRQGDVLIINCIYRKSGKAVHEIISSTAKEFGILETLEKALWGNDPIIHQVIKQALKDQNTRRWLDLFVVSFSIAPIQTNMESQIPQRIVLSIMECNSVREYDAPVINGIIDVFSHNVPDLLDYQTRPQLTDLKMWHQANSHQLTQQYQIHKNNTRKITGKIRMQSL
jgi:HEAT repeat protein